VQVYRWTGSAWMFEASIIAEAGEPGDHFGCAVAIQGATLLAGVHQDDVASNADQGSVRIFARSGNAWTEQAMLTAGNGEAGDRFGASVAVSGDTVVVGAPADDVAGNVDQGSIFMFNRSGASWVQEAQTVAADGAAFDGFGCSVSCSGETIAVGAHGQDTGGSVDRGAAYTFVRIVSVWLQEAKLAAPDGMSGDRFGGAVAVAADTVVVGAHADDVGATGNQGSAYVFVRAGTAWAQQARLTAEEGAADDSFGAAVALARDTIAVGARHSDVGVNADQGSAFVFTRTETGWVQQARLTAADGAAGDTLGASVALAGDTAVVGVPADAQNAGMNQGSVWVFSRPGQSWIGHDVALTAADAAPFDNLGAAVAVSGDTVIVGAPTDDVAGNPDQGSAYVFLRSGTVWTRQAKLVAPDGAASDYFGSSVAIDGDIAVIGARDDDVGPDINQGSAYVFVRSGSTWTQETKITVFDGAANDYFGTSVGISGETIVVGAPFRDVFPHTDQGAAYAYVRFGTSWILQGQLAASDGAGADSFGRSVAISGDSVLVGSHLDDVGSFPNIGAAYVFVRSDIAWSQQAKLSPPAAGTGDSFGFSVALDADTALIGACLDNVGAAADRGSVFVFVRSGTAWTLQATLSPDDGAAGDNFGISVDTEGDSAVVGAYFDDVGASDGQGSLYTFERSGTSWHQRAHITALDGAASDYLGSAVAFDGDTVAAGAYGDDAQSGVDQGSVRVFDVSHSDLSFARNATTGAVHSSLGSAISTAMTGEQLIGTPGAWRTSGMLDTFGQSLALASSGDLRTSPTSVLTLGGSSVVRASQDGDVHLSGQVRTSPGAVTSVTGGLFTLGSRGAIAVAGESSLTFDAPCAVIHGQTSVGQEGSLVFSGSVATTAPVTMSPGSTVAAGSVLESAAVFSVLDGVVDAPTFWNRADATFGGASAVFGAYRNDMFAVTNVQSGSLNVLGSFANSGVVQGTVCAGCAPTPPSLEIGGTFSLDPNAGLMMPIPGSLVRVGGSFGCAINTNALFDMTSAVLMMAGSDAPRTLEAMSIDIGNDEAGLDRAIPGHYPLRALHIGPGQGPVTIVDLHDNDRAGQAGSEAVYAHEVVIETGAVLDNSRCRVYCGALLNEGVVTTPANLVLISGVGGCDPTDFNNDTLFPDNQDLEDFFSVFGGGPCSTGACNDIDFNNDSLFPDNADVEAYLNVFGGGNCF